MEHSIGLYSNLTISGSSSVLEANEAFRGWTKCPSVLREGSAVLCATELGPRSGGGVRIHQLYVYQLPPPFGVLPLKQRENF